MTWYFPLTALVISHGDFTVRCYFAQPIVCRSFHSAEITGSKSRKLYCGLDAISYKTNPPNINLSNYSVTKTFQDICLNVGEK